MKKLLPLHYFFVIILIPLFTTAETGSLEIKVPITPKESLIRLGREPYFVSEEGKRVANFFWNALKNNDKEMLKKTIQLYSDLLQKESHIIDYSALKWLCECIVASEKERKSLISDELAEDFYKYWTDNNYANLKDYLRSEFKFNDFSPDEVENYFKREAYLKDFLMYNNPRRTEWEKPEEIIKYLNLKEGDSILDIGCGFGFYSYRFSKMVGKTGKVLAIDINKDYIDHLKNFVKKYKITNIVPVVSKADDISVSTPSNVAFICSLYHAIYGLATEQERFLFISSIKRSLKHGGLFVIADNSFYNGKEVNNTYIHKELIIAQLSFYGFRFMKYVPVTPQRYLLIFKHEGETASAVSHTSGPIGTGEKHTGVEGWEQEVQRLPHQGSGSLGRVPEEFTPPPADIWEQIIDSGPDKKGINHKTPYANITSGNSLIHLIPNPQQHTITKKSREAVKLVYEAIKNKDLNTAKKAISLYNDIIPVEGFRGEKSAFQWICEYLTSPQEIQTRMLKNPHTKAFYYFLAKNNFGEMREYMISKYRIQHKPDPEEMEQFTIARQRLLERQTKDPLEAGRIKYEFFEELLLFNNPKREEWEKTDRVIELLNLKEGKTIADILSRSGYYTYKFSKIVGEHGKVYAVDENEYHISFLKNFIKEQKINNIESVKLTSDKLSLEKKVDYLFLCCYYYVIYGVLSESNRANFIMSLKKALKEDGRLIIVENSPAEIGSMPYYDFYIDKELITAQLSYYGFTLERQEQITPWQYMLTFRLN